MGLAMATRDPECDVLVVEDDDDTREVLSEILSSAGYRARVARSGAEAISILDSLDAPPQLALVDVVMPGMSGLEWIHWARRQPELHEMKMIVVSGVAQPAGAEPPGVTAWVIKPPRVDQLLDMVNRLTHGHRH